MIGNKYYREGSALDGGSVTYDITIVGKHDDGTWQIEFDDKSTRSITQYELDTRWTRRAPLPSEVKNGDLLTGTYSGVKFTDEVAYWVDVEESSESYKQLTIGFGLELSWRTQDRWFRYVKITNVTPAPAKPRCSSGLVIKGQYYQCDIDADHEGLAHASKKAQAIWE